MAVTRVGPRVALLAVVLAAAQPNPAAWRVEGLAREFDSAVAQGDVALASARLDEIGNLAGLDAAAYDRQAAAFASVGDWPAAASMVEAAADAGGWSAERRARWADYSGELASSDAREAALLVELEEGASGEALSRAAELLRSAQDWAAAGQTLLRIVAADPDNAQAAYQLGLLLAPERPEYAAMYLERAAASPPHRDRAEAVRETLDAPGSQAETDRLTALGLTLVRLEEWPFAERALIAALDANAVNPLARAYLGYTRDRQGRDGWPDLRAAEAMAPNDPAIQYLTGQHWRAMGDETAAGDAFGRAFALDPGNPALVAELGVAAQHRGDVAEAERWLRAAVELEPNAVVWRALLAALYADSDAELDAGMVAFVEESQALAPDDADLAASLGWVYARMGDAGRAYELLGRAVQLDPAGARARYYYGAVLEQRGDVIGAADAYRAVLQLGGSDISFRALAARALTRLGQGSE